MTDAGLAVFIKCYHPGNRHNCTETRSPENPEGRFLRYDVKDILEHDEISLDLFRVKDKSPIGKRFFLSTSSHSQHKLPFFPANNSKSNDADHNGQQRTCRRCQAHREKC